MVLWAQNNDAANTCTNLLDKLPLVFDEMPDTCFVEDFKVFV